MNLAAGHLRLDSPAGSMGESASVPGLASGASRAALPDAVREQLRALIIEELSQLIKG